MPFSVTTISCRDSAGASAASVRSKVMIVPVGSMTTFVTVAPEPGHEHTRPGEPAAGHGDRRDRSWVDGGRRDVRDDGELPGNVHAKRSVLGEAAVAGGDRHVAVTDARGRIELEDRAHGLVVEGQGVRLDDLGPAQVHPVPGIVVARFTPSRKHAIVVPRFANGGRTAPDEGLSGGDDPERDRRAVAPDRGGHEMVQVGRGAGVDQDLDGDRLVVHHDGILEGERGGERREDRAGEVQAPQLDGDGRPGLAGARPNLEERRDARSHHEELGRRLSALGGDDQEPRLGLRREPGVDRERGGQGRVVGRRDVGDEDASLVAVAARDDEGRTRQERPR